MTGRAIKREAEDDPSEGGEDGSAADPTSAGARSSGGMSLRPGRRVRVKFEVGGEEVEAASGEGELATAAQNEEEAMAEAEADIDEVLDGDEGLGSVAREGDAASMDDLADDEDFFEVSNVVPSRRQSREGII